MSAGKLFIGGLSWETTEDSLRAVYEQFGQLSEIQIIRERQTGKPRGFGFVTYENPEDAAKACQGKHVVDGRKVDTKLSVPRERLSAGQPNNRPGQQPEPPCKKIFLGGLPGCSTEQSLRSYFVRFGEVQEILIMKDRCTGASRGFGFCTFVHPESASAALQESRTHQIDGKRVEIKPAESREACSNRAAKNSDANSGWGYAGMDQGYVNGAMPMRGGFVPDPYMRGAPVFSTAPGMYPAPFPQPYLTQGFDHAFPAMPMSGMPTNPPASWNTMYGTQVPQSEDAPPAPSAPLGYPLPYPGASSAEFALPPAASYDTQGQYGQLQAQYGQPAANFNNNQQTDFEAPAEYDVGALASQFAESSLEPSTVGNAQMGGEVSSG